ncbi:MAG: redoxin family protein, partial [Planctomycetaceae bacterium]
MHTLKSISSFCIGLSCFLAGQSTFALDAADDYGALARELKVRELSTVMFAVNNAVNLEKIESFLKKYPKTPEREKVLYLRAYSIWSMHRYEDAPQAFAQLLKEFPDSKFRRIARIREAAAYLFNGQARQALPRLQSLHRDYPDRPELYARELAYALSRCGRQTEALEFMNAMETTMIEMGKERLLPRVATHFDKIRLIGKPLPDFHIKTHRTGQVVNPETLKNKVVLIDFWASWCGPCVATIPAIQKVQKELAAKGFIVLGICLDEDQKKMEQVIADRKLTWLQ